MKTFGALKKSGKTSNTCDHEWVTLFYSDDEGNRVSQFYGWDRAGIEHRYALQTCHKCGVIRSECLGMRWKD